ncbi:transmembrane protein 104-like [Limulus polyphemus]|uniref:Transmembrane protein 104-like n=1 Tax=Limulus polyphemus TaxID=6850 RepID=A0ABM1BCC6_LIMPO|nr:transmembrane protein 104-like [Limulus polyphemus]
MLVHVWMIMFLLSYLTTTFVIEAMAAANAIVHRHAVQHFKKAIKEEEMGPINYQSELVEDLLTDEVISNAIDRDEQLPLLLNTVDSVDYYSITERIELLPMTLVAHFHHLLEDIIYAVGVNLFYLCIVVYLYGDLTIYAAAIAKSLRDVTCNYVVEGPNCTSIYNSTDPCWTTASSISRHGAYMIYLALFLCLLGPFTFFNVQKTKYLQMLTTVMRWLAFTIMIVLTSIALAKGKGRGTPPVADIKGVPNLFGVCVYSFMCHHSLPSLITPIRNKDRLFSLLFADYLLILCFYSLLSFTGIFTFENLQDVYTLNFEPQKCGDSDTVVSSVPFLQYFLALFPVFTLSTNFPIIAITLRNNLKSLFLKDSKKYSIFLERILFPVITVIPPVAIAFATESLEILVGITGSYAGAVIQYVVPALLVYYARKDSLTSIGLGVKKQHSSPFHHIGWIVFVCAWALACVIFVTVDHVTSL